MLSKGCSVPRRGWCLISFPVLKINYQFTPYIAEMANTLSNLFTIGLSLRGYHQANLQLPTRYGIGYLVSARLCQCILKAANGGARRFRLVDFPQ